MSLKVFFSVLVLIGCQSALQALAALDNSTVLEASQSRQSALEGEIILSDKKSVDKKIRHILFGKNSNVHECLNVTLGRRHQEKQQNNKKNGKHKKHDRPLNSAFIIREEMHENKIYSIQECAGSLLNVNVVLTAAHCMFNKSLTDLKVRAGLSRKLLKNSVSYQEQRIKEVVFAEGYDIESPKNDLALIFLNGSFKISPQLKPVCLLNTNAINIDYVRCLVSSWKRNRDTLSVDYTKFKKVNMTVVPNAKCERALQLTALGSNFTLDSSSMCADAQSDQTILKSNGGAPLLCPVCGFKEKMIQVGVSSWGFDGSRLPEVFTSISRFRIWIQAELKKRDIKFPDCGIKKAVAWN